MLRSTRRVLTASFAVLSVASALAACSGSDDDPGGSDAGTEASTDVGADRKDAAGNEDATDAGEDAWDGGGDDASDAADAPADTAADSPADALMDSPVDSPADAPLDSPSDVALDAPGDAVADAPADVTSDAPADAPVDAPAEASGGCMTSSDCSGKGLFCVKPAGHCDDPGECIVQPGPKSCPSPLPGETVCSCLGNEYASTCYAYVNGESVASNGPCP